MIKVEEVSGIGEFLREEGEKRELFRVVGGGEVSGSFGGSEGSKISDVSEPGKVFLVVNYGGDESLPLLEREQKTVEVRTDVELKKVLMEKYESVMESRYFGRGGIEIVLTGQISEGEIYDLVRLSYNLSV